MTIPLKIITNSSFKDKRGHYWTTWKKGVFKDHKFNHDKFSVSQKNVLRGLHCDFKSWKLVTCVYGKILLAVVDMRKNSKNYLKSRKIILSHNKPKLVLIPPYYANGHLCLSKICVFHYKWSYTGKYTDVKKQSSYKWNDPKISIKWSIKKPLLSSRDKNSKYL